MKPSKISIDLSHIHRTTHRVQLIKSGNLCPFIHIYNTAINQPLDMLDELDEHLEDELLMDCVLKISAHLERNIIKNRSSPRVANKLATMNKYILLKYMNSSVLI